MGLFGTVGSLILTFFIIMLAFVSYKFMQSGKFPWDK
jgi:hypothetical protein